MSTSINKLNVLDKKCVNEKGLIKLVPTIDNLKYYCKTYEKDGLTFNIKSKDNDDLNIIKLISKIGAGADGIVYKAIWIDKLGNSKNCAVKKISLSSRKMSELLIGIVLSCYEPTSQFVVNHHLVFFCLNPQSLFIVMEELIMIEKIHYTTSMENLDFLKSIYIQIAIMSNIMHDEFNFVHCDMKPNNLAFIETEEKLIYGVSNQKMSIKMLDFGLSCYTDSDGNQHSKIAESNRCPAKFIDLIQFIFFGFYYYTDYNLRESLIYDFLKKIDLRFISTDLLSYTQKYTINRYNNFDKNKEPYQYILDYINKEIAIKSDIYILLHSMYVNNTLEEIINIIINIRYNIKPIEMMNDIVVLQNIEKINIKQDKVIISEKKDDDKLVNYNEKIITVDYNKKQDIDIDIDDDDDDLYN